MFVFWVPAEVCVFVMTGVIYEYYLASFHKTLFIFAFYEILMFFAYTSARPLNKILCNFNSASLEGRITFPEGGNIWEVCK